MTETGEDVIVTESREAATRGLADRRVLVTGGLGFVGNEVVRQLRSGNVDVAILDNRHRVAPRTEDLASVPVFAHDVTDADAVSAVFSELRPSVVIHLAALHYIPECNADPARTIRVNVEGTQNILSAAAACGTERIVFASSGAVYADASTPLEEADRLEPVDVYGVTKLACEDLARTFAARTAVNVRAVRLFNVYGQRETNPHIIPEIIAQLRTANTLRLGNISTYRDFIHVADAASGFIRFAGLPDPGFLACNLGTGQAASMQEVIQMLGHALCRQIDVITDPSRFRPADKQVQVASTKRLASLTGWTPNTRLADGIRELLAFEGLFA